MSTRSEYEAAYFTLLRAREEHEQLLRYGEQLQAELARLDDFSAATQEAEQSRPARLRRPLSQTTKPLLQAIGARRNLVLSELGRLDERVSAAQEFVEECETEVDALKP